MRMQYELLSKEPDDRNTTTSAVDIIKSMAGGTGAHHAGALKFGLREGFSLARPTRPSSPDAQTRPAPKNSKQMGFFGRAN